MIENLLKQIPVAADEEQFMSLLQSGSLRIERIVSWGHASPADFWYDQEEHEWVLVICGAARLRFEGDDQSHELVAGSFLQIPAHCRHRVEWTLPGEPTIWLAVFWKDKGHS